MLIIILAVAYVHNNENTHTHTTCYVCKSQSVVCNAKSIEYTGFHTAQTAFPQLHDVWEIPREVICDTCVL